MSNERDEQTGLTERHEALCEEAIEAAARGMFAEEQCYGVQKLDVESIWLDRLDDQDRDEYRTLARAHLAAADMSRAIRLARRER
ncbi:hypothetical protein [Paenarthrobacter sp. CAP02]|uniref:hypothetical protein n=1 Tax=Paenarthrobacter sp. CAP02 TaxID=3158144 RepID=UPI0032DAA74A